MKKHLMVLGIMIGLSTYAMEQNKNLSQKQKPRKFYLKNTGSETRWIHICLDGKDFRFSKTQEDNMTPVAPNEKLFLTEKKLRNNAVFHIVVGKKRSEAVEKNITIKDFNDDNVYCMGDLADFHKFNDDDSADDSESSDGSDSDDDGNDDSK